MGDKELAVAGVNRGRREDVGRSGRREHPYVQEGIVYTTGGALDERYITSREYQALFGRM